jgi:hypothetical protein
MSQRLVVIIQRRARSKKEFSLDVQMKQGYVEFLLAEAWDFYHV